MHRVRANINDKNYNTAMMRSAVFATPEDCARSFYEAFSKADLEELMQCWAEDEEICCVHPGAAPLYGFTNVRSAWAAVFRNSPRMRLELRDEHWSATIAMVVQHAIEWIYVGDEAQSRGPVFVTNAFIRTPSGWRMVSHHASPIQSAVQNASSTPVLH
jgi:ketosteroid isomerase-like protein